MNEYKNSYQHFIEWIKYGLIFILIVWGVPAMLVALLGTQYPIASITSNSMWPALKSGDLVFIKGVEAKDSIKDGDIVVYENMQGFTIHRVIKINENELITQGDANNVADEAISYEQLVGKAVEINGKPLRIPYMGKLSQFYKNI